MKRELGRRAGDGGESGRGSGETWTRKAEEEQVVLRVGNRIIIH